MLNRHIELKLVKTPKTAIIDDIKTPELSPEAIATIADDFSKKLLIKIVIATAAVVVLHTLSQIAITAVESALNND